MVNISLLNYVNFLINWADVSSALNIIYIQESASAGNKNGLSKAISQCRKISTNLSLDSNFVL